MKNCLLSIAAVMLLSACTPGQVVKKDNRQADFWQRSEAVESIYLNGPKAQHQLNKDIAACVAEVKELTRLGSIRNARPPQGVATNRPMRQGWNSVTRDGPLHTEYTDFQDFEGCMDYKGWNRTQYVTPTQSSRARNVYNETIMGQHSGRIIMSGPEGNMNQKFND